MCAPAATIDAATPDGAAIPVELRPGRDLATNVTAFRPERVNAFAPANDVIPAHRITRIVTERGALDPTDPASLVPSPDEPIAPPS